MNTRQYCVWLKGVFDILSADDRDFTLTDRQLQMIKKNLDEVFTHEDMEDKPSEGDKIVNPYTPSSSKPSFGKTLIRC